MKKTGSKLATRNRTRNTFKVFASKATVYYNLISDTIKYTSIIKKLRRIAVICVTDAFIEFRY